MAVKKLCVDARRCVEVEPFIGLLNAFEIVDGVELRRLGDATS